MLVVWKWTTPLYVHDDQCAESDLSSTDTNPSDVENEDPNSSDPEIGATAPVSTSHTVTFKVIGCTKESRYQSKLQTAKTLLDSGATVPVQVTPEPLNPVDPLAIAFTCNLGGKWQQIGCVVKEACPHVHDAITSNAIVKTEFKWIKYITDWYRMGPGFFAGVSITKNGVWPPPVVRSRSTR